MNNIIIRRAEQEDIPVLRNFEQGVINAERPFDPTLKSGSIFYYDIEGMIAANHIELLVAVLDDTVIGSGYARIENAKHFLQHPEHAYLGFMYVLPDYRGLGVNKKIIDALANWSHTKNITELRLDVYFSNVPAISAYEKGGFTKHMIEMRKEII